MDNLHQNKPAVILANPQMGENIGASARAMLNFGLDELRIINPRDGWPSERAEAMSSGALSKMPPVNVFGTTKEALADFHCVYATTARPRDMVKPVMNAKDAAADIVKRSAKGQKTALLFGGERSGLSNDDIALSHVIVTVPANPDFASMNLGQCVLLTAYEWFQAANNNAQTIIKDNDEAPVPASHEELHGLYERLEDELEKGHFFRAPDMKPTIVRNLRNMLARSEMTQQEVRTFQGIISALIGNKTRGK